MELKINEKLIEEKMNLEITKAVADAVSGWKMQSAIADVITSEIAEKTLQEVIRKAVSNIDIDDLVSVLAKEMSRSVVSAVVHILEEGVLDIVCKLRGIGNYSDEDKRERERVKAILFRRGK